MSVKLVFNMDPKLSWADYEVIKIEYWPNERFDKVATNPRISSVQVGLSQFDTEAVDIS